MHAKNVAFVGAICVTIGWLLASMLTPPVARLQSPPERRGQAPASRPASAFTEQLQFRLRQLPATPTNRRNPFTFATRERTTPISAAVANRTSEPPIALAAPVPVGPPYSLSGIGITGDVRTAILTTTGHDVRIVKVGDVIGEFTVTDIGDDSVTISGAGERFTLRLAQ